MDLVIIGKTLKPYGLKGEVKVAIEDLYLDLLPDLSVLFLNLNGTSVPYFQESFNDKASLLKFEDVNSPETAKTISSKEISARREDIPFNPENQTDETLEYGHLKQFKIVDKELGELGTIINVLELPQQEMAVLEGEHQDILIPLNEAYIISINEKLKEVLMELPDGLIDLYSSKN